MRVIHSFISSPSMNILFPISPSDFCSACPIITVTVYRNASSSGEHVSKCWRNSNTTRTSHVLFSPQSNPRSSVFETSGQDYRCITVTVIHGRLVRVYPFSILLRLDADMRIATHQLKDLFARFPLIALTLSPQNGRGSGWSTGRCTTAYEERPT